MKLQSIFLSILILAALLCGCNMLEFNKDIQTITPSKNIITEQREVSGFTGIDMSALGKVTITQGDSESLTIKGSDNLLPLIKTNVSNGVLTIAMEKNVTFKSLNIEDVLAFTITVKDLTNLTVSGLGTVEMDSLATKDIKLVMSGAGAISIAKLTVDTANLNVSGLGKIVVAGTANKADIEISGAGEVNAADLQCQTVNALIPGLGDATVWATDELTGNISGGGSVKYYGAPKTNTQATGIGKFESLGSR